MKSVLVMELPKNVEECDAKEARKFGCILFDQGTCKRKDCPLKSNSEEKRTIDYEKVEIVE